MRTRLQTTTKVRSTQQVWRTAKIGMGALLLGIVALIGMQVGYVQPSQANNLPGYDNKKVITIQESKIPDGNNLIDFPVLLYHTDADLRTIPNGGYVEYSDGRDIRAALADGTELDQELELYDPATGEIALWVRYPSLPSTNDAEIHLYFGNSSISNDPSTPSTWSSNYNGVYHFDGNTNNAALSNYNAQRFNTQTTNNGFIGSAEAFDGNYDFLEIDDEVIPEQGGWTISLWGKMNTVASEQYFFHLRGKDGEHFDLRYRNENWESHKTRWQYNDRDQTRYNRASDNNQLSPNTWVHFVAIGEWEGNSTQLYIDGVLVDSDNSYMGRSFQRQRDLIIGAERRNNASNPQVQNELNGVIDELRILHTQLSVQWIEAEYNNQSDPGSFYTIGPRIPTNGSLLPIELGYFEVTPTTDGQVKLAWETLLEINNEYFAIERSKDGEHFDPLLTEPGQINSSTPTQYIRYDEHPLPGYSYYRLKQTDLDGKFEYFPIRQVYMQPDELSLQIVQAYPNPFRSQLNVVVLSGHDQSVAVRLVDASGRIFWNEIWSLKEGEQQIIVPAAALAEGYYLLQLSSSDGRQTTVPVMKAK